MPIPTKNATDGIHGKVSSEEDRLSECLQRLFAAENAISSARELLLEVRNDNNAWCSSGVESVEMAITNLIEQTLPHNPRPDFQKSVSSFGALSTKTADIAASRSKPHYLKVKSKTCGALGGEASFKSLEDYRERAIAAAKRFSISEDLALKCSEAFRHADKDDSGTIEISELRSLLEEVAGCTISDLEYKALLHKFDDDNSGTLDFDEFLMVFVNTPMQHVFKLEAEIGQMGEDARRRMQLERMDFTTRVQYVGVPRSAVKRFLRKEITEANACLAFPWAVLLFVCFTVAVLSHMRVDTLYAIDKAISFDINENANFAFSGNVPFENGRMGHKNIDDVNSHGDFWSWFNLGFVPLVWTDGVDVNEARTNVATWCQSNKGKLLEFGWNPSLLNSLSDLTDDSSECPEGRDNPDVNQQFFGNPPTPTYLWYYSVIGGVRLRQERSKLVNCPAEVGAHTGQCVPDQGYWLRPELRNAMKIDETLVDSPGGETVYLLTKSNRSAIRQQLRELENRAWVSAYTAKVELLFTTYNAHQDILTGTFIAFFMNRGGHIHKMVEPVSVYMNPYASVWNYVFDIAWAGLVMQIFISEGKELLHSWFQLGFLNGTRVYAGLGNFIDWISVIYSCVIVAFWCHHLATLGNVRRLLEKADVEIPGSWDSTSDRDDFFLLVENLIAFQQGFRTLVALYPFVIVSRFFKAFASQPRLAMVTNTMSRASIDIAHYLVVFSSIFIIFTSSANILFGQELLEFANFGRSLTAVFRIMLGDYGWVDAMHHVGRHEAGIWFWCFTWLINLVMLNMMLAIIMDVYTAVKGEIGNDTETLLSQTLEIIYRSLDVYSGRALALSVILQTLDPTHLDSGDDEEMDEQEGDLTVATFVQVVPGLKEEQAQNILLDAVKLYDADTKGSHSLTDSACAIMDIDLRTKHIHWSLEKAIHMHQMSSDLLLSTRKAERAGRRTVEGALRDDSFFGDEDDSGSPELHNVIKKLQNMVQQLATGDLASKPRVKKNQKKDKVVRGLDNLPDSINFTVGDQSVNSRAWDGCTISLSAQESRSPMVPPSSKGASIATGSAAIPKMTSEIGRPNSAKDLRNKAIVSKEWDGYSVSQSGHEYSLFSVPRNSAGAQRLDGETTN